MLPVEMKFQGDAPAGSSDAGFDTIYFDPDLENGTIMLSGPLDISDDLIICGPDANELTIDGGWNGNIFNIYKANVEITVKNIRFDSHSRKSRRVLWWMYLQFRSAVAY